MLFLKKTKQSIIKNIEPKTKICFIHIAKCGGISVNQAIRYRYPFTYAGLNALASLESARLFYHFNDPFDDAYQSVLRYRENILVYELNRGSGFISGHYAFNRDIFDKFKSKYVFMTVLRDPLERFISSYFFNVYKDSTSPWKINDSLKDYLNSEKGYLAAHDYVKLIGGVRSDNAYDTSESMHNALENLNKFHICGVLENLNELKIQLLNQCSLNIRISKKNKNPVSKKRQKDVITDKIKSEIRYLCKSDYEIYHRACLLSNLKSQI